jgi:protein arginine kinase activator
MLQGAALTGQPGTACPGCGLTHEQFQAGRRLGCARCYDVFAAELEQIFHRVQDEAVHRGKVPGRPRTAPPSPLELRRLRECLQRAVEDERFEEAARFRDQINKLSRDISPGGDGGEGGLS